MVMQSYTLDELQEIRDVLTGVRVLGAQERKNLEAAILAQAEEEREGMDHFISLLVVNKSLYNKMRNDPIFDECGGFVFLPEVYPLFYEEEDPPQAYVLGTNEGHPEHKKRDFVVAVLHGKKNCVVKAQKFPGEHVLAKIVGELGVGPQLYKAYRGFIIEEHIDGETFRTVAEHWPSSMEIEDFVFQTGKTVGTFLDTLHRAGIVYNNAVLCDVEELGVLREGHLLFKDQTPLRLVDFGTSFFVRREYTNDDVLKFAVMQDDYKLHKMLSPMSAYNRQGIIAMFRKELEQRTEEEVLRLDVGHVLDMLGVIDPTPESNVDVAHAFIGGFQETYTLPF